ncbi:NAD(P)/FAD-dependent oxidoreductase [Teichococcus aestuarii]|uniref:NAD(P)/FAD-dependent oxidoreductase n=1 Tax=Teichococcus aestuarii TaxID=568898 RepID=UPI003608FE74
MVHPVLPPPRHRPAAGDGDGHRLPHHRRAGADRGCAGHAGLLHPPARGWRLHRGAARPRHAAPDAGRAALRPPVLAHLPPARRQAEDPRRQAIPRRADGRRLLVPRPRSPFERTRVLDPAPDMALVEEALAMLRAAYPSLAGIGCAEAWAGSIDSTPDAVPVISAVEKLKGFHLATGFSGHGFGIGPAAGRLAADLVAGDAPIVDAHPYRYARLVDGTALAPAGAL